MRAPWRLVRDASDGLGYERERDSSSGSPDGMLDRLLPKSHRLLCLFHVIAATLNCGILTFRWPSLSERRGWASSFGSTVSSTAGVDSTPAQVRKRPPQSDSCGCTPGLGIRHRHGSQRGYRKRTY